MILRNLIQKIRNISLVALTTILLVSFAQQEEYKINILVKDYDSGIGIARAGIFMGQIKIGETNDAGGFFILNYKAISGSHNILRIVPPIESQQNNR